MIPSSDSCRLSKNLVFLGRWAHFQVVFSKNEGVVHMHSRGITENKAGGRRWCFTSQNLIVRGPLVLISTMNWKCLQSVSSLFKLFLFLLYHNRQHNKKRRPVSLSNRESEISKVCRRNIVKNMQWATLGKRDVSL